LARLLIGLAHLLHAVGNVSRDRLVVIDVLFKTGVFTLCGAAAASLIEPLYNALVQ
jgi:hypothetical protein